MRNSFRAATVAASLVAASLLAAVPVRAQPAPPPVAVRMSVALDERDAPTRSLAHVREKIPVAPGPLTLVYPKWIPGEHGPNGPIPNLAGLVVRGGGRTIPWTRDLVDVYAFHLDVPGGVSALDVAFDFLGVSTGNYSSSRFATPNLLSVTWNKFVLYPAVDDIRAIEVTPSITLPSPAWRDATALTETSRSGGEVRFAPVTMNQLIDSPLDAGLNTRTWHLGAIDGAPVDLAAFADTPDQLAASDKTVGLFRALVGQMHALYGARHFDHYTFLLTLSDVMPGEGVEHHQSSDDGTGGRFLVDHDATVVDGDLLPHEFNHSWDGKFRRPYDLYTTNLQVPMRDDLLWVYEGMTQFYGELQAERSGIWTRQEWLDSLASTYAALDTTTGRLSDPLLDTATAAVYLYNAPREYEATRRSVDYYPEGNLMWLEADVLIRRLSHGRRSLDDVARAFFGRSDGGPVTLTYTRADVIAALAAVQPYDWAGFFRQRIDEIAPHPPDPFTPGGWRLVYTPEPNGLERTRVAKRKTLDLRYSLGIVAREDGMTVDVIGRSPAANAGVGPGDRLVAIDGRALTDGQRQVDDVLRVHENAAAGPVRLLLSSGNVYREVAIPYTGGPRFPHLQRVGGEPDELGAIARPLSVR